MSQYTWPEEIPDDEIVRQFATATTVHFSARRFNTVLYRRISFGDLGWWLPLKRVLPLVGITPQMLRDVFSQKSDFLPRRFPLNWHWFGLNRRTRELVSIPLPETISSYDELGQLPLTIEAFAKLAKALDKKVAVLREDGGTGDHSLVFTVDASGEVTEAA